MKKKRLFLNMLFKPSRGSWNGVNPITKVVPDKKKKTNKNKCREKVDFIKNL